MIFTNFSFVLFFILYFFLNSFLPRKYHKYLLFFSNIIFVLFSGWRSLLIVSSVTIFNFFCGRNKNQLLLIVCISFDVLVLVYFKYFSNFFPVGISFYIFTLISYLVDIQKQEELPEKDLISFSNFVLYFPKFVSGPIEKKSTFYKQVELNEKLSFSNIQSGVLLFIFGFFKKVCIANRLQVYVDKIFDNLQDFGGLSLLFAICFYSILIFCDFSGYTDMALGVAKVFGIELTQNFVNPYSASSISDFWHKWHISLSSWLRNYIYIPLGGNRKGLFRKCINICITFLVSGFWHGSTVSFIIWGMFHGILQIIELLLKNPLSKINIKVRHMMTLILIGISWIFFRVNKLNDIVVFFHNLFDLSYYTKQSMVSAITGINFSTYNNMTPTFFLNFNLLLSIIFLYVCSKIEIRKNCKITTLVIDLSWKYRVFFCCLLFFFICSVGLFDSTRFIYAAF